MATVMVRATAIVYLALVLCLGASEAQPRARDPKYYKWPLSQLGGAGAASRFQHVPGSRGREGGRLRRAGPEDKLPYFGEDEPGVLPGPGPSPADAQQLDLSKMRYWNEYLQHAPPGPMPLKDKFISFEPWNGGFNNIRMSIEFAMALALVTNRTLVLPDNYNMYKLPGVNAWSDFFDIEDMARGVPIMHQKDFLDKFNLPNRNGRTDFPDAPGPWRSRNYADRGWQGLWEISTSYGFGEDIGKKGQQANLIYCVPDCPVKGEPHFEELETFRKRRMKTVSTSSWDNSQIVHFSQNGLGHWYMSMFLRPKTEDLKLKINMRTFFHFNDEIFDHAETVLRALYAKGVSSFSCMHIRRGDFQFKEVWTTNEEIIENNKQLFKPGEDMWIMTEEKDPHGFFAEIGKEYPTHYLKDFMKLLPDINKAQLPMVESVICSRARIFSGTWLSTMSGYINRLRGYMKDVDNKEVYFNQFKYPDEYQNWDNKYPTWLYAKGPKGKGVPGWAREFREVWDMEWDMTMGHPW